MNDSIRIAKNAATLMGVELGLKAVALVVSALLARYLAPSGFGLLAFAVSFASLFDIIAGFGMGTLTTRDLARDMNLLSRYQTNGLVAKALLSVATLALIALSLWVMRYSPDQWPIVLLAGLVVALEATLRFNVAFFQAAQQMGRMAILNLLCDVGWLLSALAVMALHGGVFGVLAGRVAVTLLVVLLSVRWIHTCLGRLSWQVDPKFIGRMLKSSLPFALSTLFLSIYADIDMVMISLMRGNVMAGWYAVSRKFPGALAFIPMSIRGASLPAFSKTSAQDPSKLSRAVEQNVRFLILIAMPIAGWIFLFSDPLVCRVFGSNYRPAVPALEVLIWSVPFAFMNHTLWAALVALKKEKWVTVYMGTGALLNILTNWWAIPRWGHVGAAATTVLSYATVFLLEARLLHKMLPECRLFKPMVRPLAAVALMLFFAWFFRGCAWPLVAAGALPVYLGFLIASGAIGMEEWAFVREVVRWRAAS